MTSSPVKSKRRFAADPTIVLGDFLLGEGLFGVFALVATGER